MKKNVLGNLLLAPFTVGRNRFGKLDFGALKVAMMIAALDGEVLPEEYATFDKLAKKCAGFTPKAAKDAFDEALRSAGYLLLQRQRLGEKKLVRIFVEEAAAAMPVGFAWGDLADVRRAFVMWMAMAMGDGDFSGVERECIEALHAEFGVAKSSYLKSLGHSAGGMFEALWPLGVEDGVDAEVGLLPRGFLDLAEDCLARLSRAAARCAKNPGSETAAEQYRMTLEVLEDLVRQG